MTQNKIDLLIKLRDYVESPDGARISKFPQYQLLRAKFGSVNKALEQAGVIDIYKKKKKKERRNSRQSDEDLLEELKQFIMLNDIINISEFPKYQRVYYRFGSMENAIKLLELEKKNNSLIEKKKIHVANKKYSDEELKEKIKQYYKTKVKNPNHIEKNRSLWLYRFETQRKAIDVSGANGLYLLAKINRILELDLKEHEEKLTQAEKNLFNTISYNISEFVQKNY